jgi:hypothetical protein
MVAASKRFRDNALLISGQSPVAWRGAGRTAQNQRETTESGARLMANAIGAHGHHGT